MSQKNARRPLILLFLLSQILSTIAFTTPPTDNVSPLNITKTPTASSSTPLENLISQDENATSPNSPEKNIFDYRIVGTPLVLRITELGSLVTRNAVNRIIDAGIRRVVAKINTGFGPKPIEEGKFWVLSTDIDMRITALEGAKLNYFLLGDVLAGSWQYMNQPWSSFREIVFDIIIILAKGDWDYIGYGHLAMRNRPDPPPSPPPKPSTTMV